MLKKITALFLVLVLCFSITACAGEQGPQGEQGIQGSAGKSVTLVSLEKTKTEGIKDTYTMTFSDGTISAFTITNGANGADGKNGATPSIGENGNWWIGEFDTGVKAEGISGLDGLDGITASIGENGNWWFGDKDTGVHASGTNGENGKTPFIGENGNWWIGDKDTGVCAGGIDGEDGEAGNDGLSPHVGENGNWWLGETDTGVIAEGEKGIDANTAYIGENGNWWFDGEDTGFEAQGTVPVIGENGNWWISGVDSGIPAGITVVNSALLSSIEQYSSTASTVTYKIDYTDDTFAYFTLVISGDGKSDAVAAYEANAEIYGGELDEWVIEYATMAFDKLAPEGSALRAKTLGSVMARILNEFDEYFVAKQNIVIFETVPIDTFGNINWNGGKENVTVIENVKLDEGEVRVMINYSGMEKELQSANGSTNTNTYHKGSTKGFAFNGTHIEVAQGNRIRVINSKGGVVNIRVFECFTKDGDNYEYKGGKYFSDGEKIPYEGWPSYYEISDGTKWYVSGTTHFRVGLDQSSHYTAGCVVQEYTYAFEKDTSNKLKDSAVNKILETDSSGDGMNDAEEKLVVSTVLGYPSITKESTAISGGTLDYLYSPGELEADEALASFKNTLKFEGDVLELTGLSNTLNFNKTLTLKAKLSAPLGEGEAIYLSHGFEENGASVLKITSDKIEVYSVDANGYAEKDRDTEEAVNCVYSVVHELSVYDYINVVIDNSQNGKALLTLSTPSGMFQSDAVDWLGSNGTVQMRAVGEGLELTDVSLKWLGKAYSERVWIYGNPADLGWSELVMADGYSDIMISGSPDMTTEACLEQLMQDLAYGTPQYIVWCCGMEKADAAVDSANPEYTAATAQFLKLCVEKGITPILTTAPSCPTVSHFAKNEWIKASGSRYIDLAKAVGADRYNAELINGTDNTSGAAWYEDLLSEDGIHATEKGTALFYAQVLFDFPEITKE